MEIVVFGAGSLGSLIGGLLAREHAVTLVGRDPHVSTVCDRGLRVTGEYDVHVNPAATTDATGLGAALAVVTVKSFDTLEAADALATGEFGSACSLQNGMGNEEFLESALDSPVLAGTATYGAVLREPGRVECTGTGTVALGVLGGGRSDHAERAGRAFERAGLDCTVADDMPRRLWEKLAVNAAINPMTALTGVKNGAILNESPWPIAREAARETAAVAREAGVDLTDEAAVDALRRVVRATAANTSSMARDLERGRRTEIDAINGYVVDRAAGTVPVNATLTGLIKTRERVRGLR